MRTTKRAYKALTCAAGLLLCASSASAQVYTGYKWNTTTRTFLTSWRFYDEEKAAIMRGMTTWNNVSSTRFDFVDGGFTSSYHAGESTGCDGTSGIDMSPSISGLAAAVMRQCATTGGTYVDADLIINEDMVYAGSFYTGTGMPPSNQVDLQSISVHEFGHGLGLANDRYSLAVVMYPDIGQGEVRRTLHSRDQTGMRTLYPF